MKYLILLVIAFSFQNVIAQVQINSSEYQELKENDQLSNVILIQDSSIQNPSGKIYYEPSVKSNGCECYVEPDASYTLALAPNDDGSSAVIPIPFNFCMYGQTYNQIYINNNGNVTFDNPMSSFSSTAFPSSGNAIVAPFWGDVDTRNGYGQVVYKVTPTAVYINWVDVGYYSMHGDKRNTFQLTITDGVDPAVESGNVAFCYKDMEWTTGDASSGTNGFGGVPATAGANKGDGISYFLIARFDHAGTDFDGALGNADGISWLDNKSFYFDACNIGNIPPIPEGISACDTFRVCALGDTADISINFLSPESNQSTSITWSNGGLTNLQEIANISGNTASLILRVIGEVTNVGSYNVSVTATDNNTPIAGVTTVTFVIEIDTTGLSSINPVLTPLGGCDSLTVSVLNGPYDSYLWDDFTVGQTSFVDQAQIVAVTVKKNGCYKRIEEYITILEPFDINLQGNTLICAPDLTTTLTVPNASYYDSITWGLSNLSLDTLFSNALSEGTYNISLWDSLHYCTKDTTVVIDFATTPIIFNDTVGCDMSFQVTGTQSASGGTWSTTSPNITFLPSNTVNNPTINTTAPGTYTVVFTNDVCNYVVDATIIFPQYPVIFDDTSLCNLSLQVSGTQAYTTGGVWTANSPNVSFNPSNTSLNPTITSSTSGNYIITFTDNVCNNSVSTNITQIQPPSIFSDALGCNHFYQIENTVSFDGGVWTVSDTAVHFVPSTTNSNPLIYTSTPGTYTLTFTDNECNMTVSSTVYFPPYAWTEVLDTVICVGSSYVLSANENATIDNFVWSNGANGPTITVTEPGEYIVTASNVCHTYIDTATIGTKVCEINAPNVIVLSSNLGNNAFFVQYEGVETFECTILNRWGNKIYEYFDPSGNWDGRTMGGATVEEGTYFYIVKAKFFGGEEVMKQGFVQVRY